MMTTTVRAESQAYPASGVREMTNLPLAYLRVLLVMLVIVGHSTLAYYPTGFPMQSSLLDPPRAWLFVPVTDAHQSRVFGLIFNWCDSFVIALMFFTSGLFVWKSLMRKQPASYLKDRVLRLGVPFALVTLCIPLAYYPSYLQSRVHRGFWYEWLHLGTWPSAHLWFIWVLLVFDLLAIAIFRFVPVHFLGLARILSRQPAIVILACLILLSAATCVPLSLRYGRLDWTGWGPFYFQISSIFEYVIYFLLGMALGASGKETFLKVDGSFSRKWLRWSIAAAAGYGLLLFTIVLAHHIYYPVALWTALVALSLTASCALTGFAIMSCFLYFVAKRNAALDSLFACGFGIYLFHYFFVSWAQFSIVSLSAPAWLKYLSVVSATTLLSWGFTALLRRSRLIARFL